MNGFRRLLDCSRACVHTLRVQLHTIPWRPYRTIHHKMSHLVPFSVSSVSFLLTCLSLFVFVLFISLYACCSSEILHIQNKGFRTLKDAHTKQLRTIKNSKSGHGTPRPISWWSVTKSGHHGSTDTDHVIAPWLPPCP